MGRSLFVGGKNMGDLVLMLVESIINIQDRAARISEHGVHTLLLQALYQDLCSC